MKKQTGDITRHADGEYKTPKGKHTGKHGRHHHEDVHGGSHDPHAHASHHHMNKAHGTPSGLHADEEYGSHEHDKGLAHGVGGESMTEQYQGSEGQGVPDMESNDTNC